MDLFYIRNMSIRLDLTIIFKTIPALIKEVINRPRIPRGLPLQGTVYHPRRLAGGANGAVNKL
jgi:hypothetical protein